MSYRTKREVLAGIGKRVRMRNGVESVMYDAYLGYDPYTKKQKRMQSSDLSELKAQIERFYIEHRVGGDAAARLQPFEATDAREAIDLLKAHGEAISLAETVRRYLGGHIAAKQACAVKLGDALAKFIDAQVGKSDGYLRSIKCHVGAFIDRFGPEKEVCEVMAADVTDDIRERILDKDNPKTWKTYNNHLGSLKTFFKWCARSDQGYIEKSPLEDAKRIIIAWTDPAYVKVDDVKKLFVAIANGSASCREDLADSVLSFFCGMRNAEIERVREGSKSVNIDVENGFIRVVKCKGSTQGRRPRAFNIPEPALTWMRAFDFSTAVLRPNPLFRHHLIEYAKAAKYAVVMDFVNRSRAEILQAKATDALESLIDGDDTNATRNAKAVMFTLERLRRDQFSNPDRGGGSPSGNGGGVVYNITFSAGANPAVLCGRSVANPLDPAVIDLKTE